MTGNRALETLTKYIEGCDGELSAGWRAEEHWEHRDGAPSNIEIKCWPPKDFRHADGTARQSSYKNLERVAKAMGLKPNRFLAGRLTEAARTEMKKATACAKSSSPGPQDTDARTKPRTSLDAELEDDSGAASGRTKVSKHGAAQAPSNPAQAYQSARDHPPAPVPRNRLGMRDSRSSWDFPTHLAVAEEPNLAAPLAPASGVQENSGGHHSKGEMQRLQQENIQLKQRLVTLEGDYRSRLQDKDNTIELYNLLRNAEAGKRK